jgi:hypothetical protein
MSEETPLPSADDRAVEPGGESPTPTWAANGTSGSGGEIADPALTDAGGNGDIGGVTTTASPDDGSAFLANLASAMKQAATAERTRASEDVDRRRETHLAGIETRRESEAGRIQQLADDDRTAIQAWVEAEQQRIDEERGRRVSALEADLQASLAEHGAKIDAEKAQVEAAITAHRADLDAYFGKLEGETDPVAIAQGASQRPSFPDLDAIGKETAPAVAAGEPDRMIGVMASSRPTTKLSQAWAAWNASTAAAEATASGTGATDVGAAEAPSPVPVAGAYVPPAPIDPQVNPVDPTPPPEPVGVAAGGESPAEPTSPESAPEAQPQSSFGGMSWLRRDKGGDQGK